MEIALTGAKVHGNDGCQQNASGLSASSASRPMGTLRLNNASRTCIGPVSAEMTLHTSALNDTLLAGPGLALPCPAGCCAYRSKLLVVTV